MVEEVEEVEEVKKVKEVEEVEEVEKVEEVEEEEEKKKEEGIVVLVRERNLLEKEMAKILLQILHLVIMRMLMLKRLTKNSS